MTKNSIKPVFGGISEIKTITGYRSTNTIYKLMQLHAFPRPLKIDGINRWVLAEVETWTNEQIAKARTHSAPI